jgi:hypothetical protein
VANFEKDEFWVMEFEEENVPRNHKLGYYFG